jgi:hypothetical protein
MSDDKTIKLIDFDCPIFRDSSHDDLTSMCEQIFDYEDRFRVDRRKLELMILGERVPDYLSNSRVL